MKAILYIRTDANSEIASGHLLRCLVVAEEYRAQGGDVCFIVSEDESVSFLAGKGFNHIRIEGNWNNLEHEIDETQELIKQYGINKILIDSYGISEEYCKPLSNYASLIYLGSLQVPMPSLKLLVNYSNEIDEGFYHTYYGDTTTLLLGVSYAPIAKEFRDNPRIHADIVQHVLLTTGNTNPENASTEILRTLLKEKDLDNITFCVLPGRMNPFVEDLRRLANENTRVIVMSPNTKTAEVIKRCELAVSSAGTTLFELCACGLPTISFAVSDEQVSGAKQFSSDGVISYAGNYLKEKDMCVQNIRRLVSELVSDKERRCQVGQNMRRLIDGQGTKRIVDAIKSL
jgi:UDP-2,4-diacetamido-2,4,6-trideoxy-beta-L-altropyranose hydrolase